MKFVRTNSDIRLSSLALLFHFNSSGTETTPQIYTLLWRTACWKSHNWCITLKWRQLATQWPPKSCWRSTDNSTTWRTRPKKEKQILQRRDKNKRAIPSATTGINSLQVYWLIFSSFSIRKILLNEFTYQNGLLKTYLVTKNWSPDIIDYKESCVIASHFLCVMYMACTGSLFSHQWNMYSGSKLK